MKHLAALFERLWFEPMTPITLAVCRIITGIYAFDYLTTWRRALLRSAGGAPEVFHPIGVARILDQPIPVELYDGLFSLCVFLSSLFTAGVLHRILAPIFAVALLFVLSYSNSWAMVFHTENMVVVHVLILAIAPSAAALSIDASYTREDPKLTRFGLARHEPEADMKFRWPVRVLQLGATLPYVVAGVAKVDGAAGWTWAMGTNLRDQITMNGLYYEVLMDGAEPITFQVYGWDGAFMFAATMTLVLELGAPLALLHRWAGYVFVAGIMSMHWSILILMGIPFPYQLYGCAFACFFVWDRPVTWLTAKTQSIFDRLPRGSKTEGPAEL
jgi:hypothetical protein